MERVEITNPFIFGVGNIGVELNLGFSGFGVNGFGFAKSHGPHMLILATIVLAVWSQSTANI